MTAPSRTDSIIALIREELEAQRVRIDCGPLHAVVITVRMDEQTGLAEQIFFRLDTQRGLRRRKSMR